MMKHYENQWHIEDAGKNEVVLRKACATWELGKNMSFIPLSREKMCQIA